VPAFQAQLLDVRAGRLRYPQPVEGQQREESVLGGRSEPCGDQEGTKLVAVQGGGVRYSPAGVGGRAPQASGLGVLLDGVLVARDGAQPPGDGCAGMAASLQFPGEGL
jgi:hypothetical protein